MRTWDASVKVFSPTLVYLCSGNWDIFRNRKHKDNKVERPRIEGMGNEIGDVDLVARHLK